MLRCNKKTGLALVISAGLTGMVFSGTTLADDQGFTSNLSVDVGFGRVSPRNANSDINGLGIPAGTSVDVSTEDTIAATISYHVNDNLSYQMYLAPPIGFDIAATGPLAGLGNIVETDVLLPTFMVNYSFDVTKKLKTYVGAGINYTIFSSEASTPALEAALGGATSVKIKNDFALALQAGVHYDLSDQWYLNANYLWLDLDTEATTNTGGIERTVDLGLDPSIGYVSIGYRF